MGKSAKVKRCGMGGLQREGIRYHEKMDPYLKARIDGDYSARQLM
jgi:hypothetical protein